MPNPAGSRRLSTFVSAVILTSTCVVVAPRFAHADAVSCQRAVAKASAQFVQAKLKALQKCNDMVVSHITSGPCPDGTASAKIAKAESKLRTAVSKGCGGVDRTCGAGSDDEPLGGVGWGGGACPNFENGSCNNAITNCNGVSDCLECVG